MPRRCQVKMAFAGAQQFLRENHLAPLLTNAQPAVQTLNKWSTVATALQVGWMGVSAIHGFCNTIASLLEGSPARFGLKARSSTSAGDHQMQISTEAALRASPRGNCTSFTQDPGWKLQGGSCRGSLASKEDEAAHKGCHQGLSIRQHSNCCSPGWL